MKSFIRFIIEQNLLLEDRIGKIKEIFKDKVKTTHDTMAQHRDSDAVVDHFATHADPTPTKNYTQWVMNRYNSGNFRQEDHPRIRTALSNFDKHKGKLEKKDINQYKSLSEVEDAVAPHIGSKSGKEQKKEVKAEGADLIHDGPELQIHKLKSQEAACQYGAGTQWCTAARENNMFNHYNKQGPLYVVRNKKTGKKHQLHFESSQFMDERDEPVKLSSLTQKHPELKDIKEFQDKPNTGLAFVKSPKELNEKVSEYLDRAESDHEHENASETAEEHLSHPDVSEKNLRRAYDMYKNKKDSNYYMDRYHFGQTIAAHKNLPKDVIDDMISSRYELLSTLADNPNLTKEHIKHIAALDSKNDRYSDPGNRPANSIYRNPNLSSEDMHSVIDDYEKGVATQTHYKIQNLLKNPSLSEEHMQRIIKINPHHTSKIAAHPNTTDKIHSKIIDMVNENGDDDNDNHWGYDAINAIASNPSTSPKILKKMFHGSQYGPLALNHPKFPREEIDNILNDPETRSANFNHIADSPHAKNSDLLMRMMNHVNPKVRQAAAMSEHLGSKGLTAALSHPDPEVAKKAMGNFHVEPNASHYLAALNHPDNEVRNLGQNVFNDYYRRPLDSEVGQTIAGDREKYKTAFNHLLGHTEFNKYITPDHLENVINDRSSSPGDRLRAALHPKATEDQKRRVLDMHPDQTAETRQALKSVFKLLD